MATASSNKSTWLTPKCELVVRLNTRLQVGYSWLGKKEGKPPSFDREACASPIALHTLKQTFDCYVIYEVACTSSLIQKDRHGSCHSGFCYEADSHKNCLSIKQRKTTEIQIIYKLGILKPNGLKINFAFL